MNKSTTTGLSSNVTRVILAVAVCLSVWTSTAAAQDTLGSLVQETGCNWLIGKWAGQTDEGQKYEIEYKWALKDHVISVHFKGFNFEYHGIMFFDADKEEVVQIGVDNNGRNSKGTWMADYGEATMRSEGANEYGEPYRMGFVYSRTDGQMMKCELYGVDQYGGLSDQPGGTLEYKRRKK